MLAASMLVLLAQIYLSSSLRASSPAAVPPSQSANVMPRVTLEGGSLCHAAPWSLAHLRAQCQTGPLRYFYAYAALQSSWNAFQHIRRCHRHCTYIRPCRLMRARTTHTRASHAYTRVPCIHCMHTLCVPIHATQPPGRRRVRGHGARRARAHRRSRADRHAQLLEAARAGLAAVAALAGAAHQPHVGHGGGLQEGPAGAYPRAALRRRPVPAHARLLPLAR